MSAAKRIAVATIDTQKHALNTAAIMCGKISTDLREAGQAQAADGAKMCADAIRTIASALDIDREKALKP